MAKRENVKVGTCGFCGGDVYGAHGKRWTLIQHDCKVKSEGGSMNTKQATPLLTFDLGTLKAQLNEHTLDELARGDAPLTQVEWGYVRRVVNSYDRHRETIKALVEVVERLLIWQQNATPFELNEQAEAALALARKEEE